MDFSLLPEIVRFAAKSGGRCLVYIEGLPPYILAPLNDYQQSGLTGEETVAKINQELEKAKNSEENLYFEAIEPSS